LRLSDSGFFIFHILNALMISTIAIAIPIIQTTALMDSNIISAISSRFRFYLTSKPIDKYHPNKSIYNFSNKFYTIIFTQIVKNIILIIIFPHFPSSHVRCNGHGVIG